MGQWALPDVPVNFYRHPERNRAKAEKCAYYQPGLAGLVLDIPAKQAQHPMKEREAVHE